MTPQRDRAVGNGGGGLRIRRENSLWETEPQSISIITDKFTLSIFEKQKKRIYVILTLSLKWLIQYYGTNQFLMDNGKCDSHSIILK